MNKKVFVLIIMLMSISLIGIVAVQVFWIKRSFELAENQFKSDVGAALIQVSEDISERELNDFYQKISRYAQSRDSITESELKNFYYQQIDTVKKETFEYAQTILEENYKFPTQFFENDSIEIKKFFSKEKVRLVKNVGLDEDLLPMSPTENFVRHQQLTNIEKMLIENQSQVILARLPILQRISNQEIVLNLNRALEQRGITTDYKYGVYNNDFATKLKSGYFKIKEENSYMVRLFVNDYGESEYQLYVSFPHKKQYLLSSVGKILGLSALFIVIIILAFISSLYQMLKQKQISEIKTDFINNMTHEFKTPIATINLALDAIKNPKIIDDKGKVMNYVKMIRDENKRMHAQVENVLRISKLEKNQLDVSKEKCDLHDLIDEAITHVELLIESKGGRITKDFKASLTEVLANSFHMTNVIVNILDNAIKYSSEAPIVAVYTESTAKNIIMKVKDEGVGMSKNVQKNIFKKFYREETGNIHNVKGHGLGLSYVKKIIELHEGTVFVESEKGKGSTFTIKLPLI